MLALELLEDDGVRCIPGVSPGFVLRWRLNAYRPFKLIAGERRLDVGCGYGYGAAMIGAVGLERNYDILRFGRRLFTFPAICADGLWLPFPDGCFDLVTAVEVIRFVPDPGGLLSELVRVCRGGGHVGISVVDEERVGRWEKRKFNGPNPYIISNLKAQDVEDMMLEAGLADIQRYRIGEKGVDVEDWLEVLLVGEKK